MERVRGNEVAGRKRPEIARSKSRAAGFIVYRIRGAGRLAAMGINGPQARDSTRQFPLAASEKFELLTFATGPRNS